MIPRLLKRFLVEYGNVWRLLPIAGFARWSACLLKRLPAVVQQRSLGPVDDLFGPDFAFKANGRILMIRGGSFGLVREIFGQQCYITADELRPLRWIIDLGSNCGTFSLFALCNAPEARVQGVEALPELARRAQQNLAANQMGDRGCIQNGIVGNESSPWSEALEKTSGPIERFDGKKVVAGMHQVDFLKCDIEGAEYELFAGDLSWLSSVNRLAIEYHGDWAQGEKLSLTLRSAGYSVTQVPHGILGYLYCLR